MDLFEAAFDPRNISEVLNRFLDKNIAFSVLKKYCYPEYQCQLIDRITAGKYKIKPPKVVQIPKDNGGTREILICNPQDRFILALCNQAYFTLYEDKISSACKAYRKGLSTASTVREAARFIKSGYKLDLSKYFDSVSKEMLEEMLNDLDTRTPLDDVIRSFYNDDRVVVNGTIVPRYKSLGQGCATSAFFADYLLRDLDEKMQAICEYYCRYSDDMLILGKNADEALVVLQQELLKYGLTLNPKKIEAINETTEFKFLGFGIKGSEVTISQQDVVKKKKEIKHALKMVDKKLDSEQKLKECVSAVQHIFFNYRTPEYGWLYSKCKAINTLQRIHALDEYAKDCIRATVTGSWNFTHNMHKIPETKLRDAGYVSLVHMAKMAQLDSSVFREEQLLCISQHMR